MIFLFPRWDMLIPWRALVFGYVVPLVSSREPTKRKRFQLQYSEATVLSGEGGSGGPPFSSGKMDGSNLTQAWQVVHHKGMQDTCMKTEIWTTYGKITIFPGKQKQAWRWLNFYGYLGFIRWNIPAAGRNIHLSDGHLTVILLMGLEVLQTTCMGFAWTFMKV